MNLDDARRNVTSQHGEDGILEAVFAVLGVSRGVCVEFGAWDGKKFSNTYNLIVNKGWSGVLIEADADRFVDLQTTYRDRMDVIKINRVVGFDPPDTLDEILAPTEISTDFDLLSIDIDGNDYHVFESMTCRPKIVVIEFNPSIPNHLEFVQPRDMRCNQGSSLFSITTLAQEKGYELVVTTTCNAVFVRRDLFERFEIQDNSLAALHTDIRLQTYVVQLYDGTLLLAGWPGLIWHDPSLRIRIPQVLPDHLRKFPDALKGDHK